MDRLSGSPAGWEGILDPGERILWQGRPGTALDFRKDWKTTLGGIPFFAFSVFWTSMALWMTSQAPGPVAVFFPLWGLMFCAIGLYMLVGHVLWDRFKRQNTWYTLTDRRAIIATQLPLAGPRLKSYPITGGTRTELVPGAQATIYFATEQKTGRNGTQTKKIGFERIPEGSAVYAKIRELQQRNA